MVLDQSHVLARLDVEPLIVIVTGIVGVVAWILIYNVRKAYETRQREQTRRDVAAYVAEGSIKPQDAATILNAGSNQTEEIIADGVAWGTIKPEKAESLLRSLRADQAPPRTAT